MIVSIQHKGLRHLYEDRPGKHKGIIQTHEQRLLDILLMMDSAKRLLDMNAPGLHLHPLKYNRSGFWAIDVDERWRIEFIWQDGDASEVNYVDYHKKA